MVLECCSCTGAGGVLLEWCWRGHLGMLLEGRSRNAAGGVEW